MLLRFQSANESPRNLVKMYTLIQKVWDSLRFYSSNLLLGYTNAAGSRVFFFFSSILLFKNLFIFLIEG